MRLLLAEDEKAMAEAVADILSYHQYHVDTALRGDDALQMVLAGGYDGVILDVMMPGLDGLQVLSRMRKQGLRTPVLLLTAKGEVEDKVAGFEMGADDYLVKPFAMAELLVRVKALLRHGGAEENLGAGCLRLDKTRAALCCGALSQPLSRLEYRLMELFISNPGRIYSADALLSRVWGMDSDAEIGTVWVYISYLRKKLASLGAAAAIRSKHGVGYYLEVEK